jgi:cytochrome o ubiquinol oxidase subunit II
VVQVVALDWKWLFLYPEQGIAVVNEMAAPVDRPIQFQITASSVMNAFYVPELAGMIYAMPGMQTKLHAVINKPGNFEGFSANYSGAGFSHMRFRFHALDNEGFEKWAQKARDNGKALSREGYMRLEEPSEKEPVRYYNAVTAGLYDAIVDRCVDTRKMCMSQMMAIDSSGGMGLQGISGVATKPPAREQAPERSFVTAQLCTVNDPTGQTTQIEDRRPQ